MKRRHAFCHRHWHSQCLQLSHKLSRFLSSIFRVKHSSNQDWIHITWVTTHINVNTLGLCHIGVVITMTSWWVQWRLKSPACRRVTQPFVQAKVKENISTLGLCHIGVVITMTSWWVQWRLKSPACRWFTQPFVQAKVKETSKLRVTGLCEGNSPATGEFPTQRASHAENVSIRWRHHVTNKIHVSKYNSYHHLFPAYSIAMS